MILEVYQVLKVKMTHNTGVYRFKKGFNPEFVEFVNELYIVFNPLMNFIFNVSEKVYKNFGFIKSRLKRKKKD